MPDEDSSIYFGSDFNFDGPHLLEERCVGARCFFKLIPLLELI